MFHIRFILAIFSFCWIALRLFFKFFQVQELIEVRVPLDVNMEDCCPLCQPPPDLVTCPEAAGIGSSTSWDPV